MVMQPPMDPMRGMLPPGMVNQRGMEFEQERKGKLEQEARDRDDRDRYDKKGKGEGRDRKDARGKDDSKDRRSPDSTRSSDVKSFGETTKSDLQTRDKDARVLLKLFMFYIFI